MTAFRFEGAFGWRAAAPMVVGLASLSGCASFSSIVQQRGADAALCHVSNPDDARRVIPPVLAEARLAWRVRYVTRADLPDLDEASARALFDRFVIAIVDLRIGDQTEDHKDPETFFDVRPGVIANTRFSNFGGSERLRLDPLALTALTGEPLPRSKTVSGTAYASGALPRALLTLGLSLVFEKTHPVETTVADPTYHFEKEAPIAARLEKAFDKAFPNTQFIVLRRPSKPQRATVVADLHVATSDGEDCRAGLTAMVESPPIPLGQDIGDPATFHPFVVTSWRNASVDTNRRNWLYRDQSTVEVAR